MWCGESLVQVRVHDVEAEVARACDGEQRVEVRSVAVDEAAGAMDPLADLEHRLVEEAECARNGDHEAGHRIVQ